MVPAGHISQLTDPDDEDTVPIPHGKQTMLPLYDEKYPGGHFKQVEF